jgi:hypothetical protein
VGARGIEHRANEVLQSLFSNQYTSRFVDATYLFPNVYYLNDGVKFIALSQKPTC